MRIGDVDLPNRAWLAPLAGVSDVPFRRVCQEQGAGLTYVEMLASTALRHGTPRSDRMLARHAAEPILGAQVTGPSADDVAWAIETLNHHPYDTIDINMGCPVRKVVGKGWGAAILKEPDRVEATITAARAATSRPVTAKIRLGYEKDRINVAEISRRVAAAGATLLIIHGRTREDGYAVPVNYERIREGIAAARTINPSMPCMGNGDIFDYPTACAMVRRTGCDAVLVSRGALGNPWVFGQITGEHETQPTLAEWREVLDRHLSYHEDFYRDDPVLAVRFRKHLLWYATGFPGTRKLRNDLMHLNTIDEIRAHLDGYCANFPPDLPRYDGAERVASREREEHDPKGEMDRVHDRGVETM
jgi:tRNA-dihydrouridine synthase B